MLLVLKALFNEHSVTVCSFRDYKDAAYYKKHRNYDDNERHKTLQNQCS